MLQAYAAQGPDLYVEQGRGAGLTHYFRLAKRRALYFLIPFVLVFAAGSVLVAIQRSIYLAEGKILVESQDIPKDLVKPTVTDTANQRIQVIQQRIMTRDNLLTIVNKFGLFAAQRKWLSPTQLLELMRERTKLKLVELNKPTYDNNNLTLALTLSYEYEDPQIAMRVANEFLTLILGEDARTRTNRAAETTKFLNREVKRLETELAAVEAKITEFRRGRPKTATNTTADQLATELTKLKAELLQKSSQYSQSHPDVKALKRRIAGLEELIAKTAQAATTTDITGIEELLRQRLGLGQALDDANRKLAAARLGESLERDQQSERLQVIEQPTVPQKPERPNRPKLFLVAFAFAIGVGAAVVFLVESLDRSIRTREQLFGIIDPQFILSIPYITTKDEVTRKKSKSLMLWAAILLVVLAGGAAVLYFVQDLSTLADRQWVEMFRAWLDNLTRLSK